MALSSQKKGPAEAATSPSRGSQSLEGQSNMDSNTTGGGRRQDIGDLLKDACTNVRDRRNGVKVLTDVLADQMQKIHGGSWRIDIDHEHQFIMVVARSPKHDTSIQKADLKGVI
jgi:hypothetical protein